MKELLQLLKQNARLSNAELAVMMGKTEAEVAAEITELERAGVIRGYSVILDEELADRDAVSAYIELKITPKPDSGFDELAKTVMAYDEVESVTLMSGGYDLGLTVTGYSLRDIAAFVAQRLSALDGVLSTTTHFVLKRYKDKGISILDEQSDERGVYL
ncbi:MAG: Lrp/AsnC family transcriptional regulator [Oscillospiraceae bacterium]|nr:Lrp/AsnC family transcriptional regulator [Oscillospiraceae bacterium]